MLIKVAYSCCWLSAPNFKKKIMLKFFKLYHILYIHNIKLIIMFMVTEITKKHVPTQSNESGHDVSEENMPSKELRVMICKWKIIINKAN